MKKTEFEIFVYHRVGDSSTLDGLTISKDAFERQMQFFRRERRPMALGKLAELIRNKKPIPENAVAVTFDDGYKDTFDAALPVLKKFKIPATVFITTGFIDRTARGYENAPMMSWAMVKKLQKSGIEIGAHTVSHPNLTACTVKEVRRQMIGSKKRLEEKLKARIRLFAYPYGGRRSVSQKIQACAEECGFDAACTTLPGKNGPRTNLYALRRQPSLRDELRDLALQLEKAAVKFSADGTQIKGFNPKAAKIWKSQYKKTREWIR